MKNLIGVLLFIWAGGWLVSCETTDAAASLEVQELNLSAEAQGCEVTPEPAIFITAHDAHFNGTLLTGLRVTHRINGGPWQPEAVSSETAHPIPGTAGTYEIEVRKDEYKTQYGTIIVPREENCTILPQTWDIILKRQNPCPSTPAVLNMSLATKAPGDSGFALQLNGNHQSGLDIRLSTPNDTQELSCSGLENCNLNVELNALGDYVLEFGGFLDHRRMTVLNDVVSYSYTNLAIDLYDGRNAKRTILTEGASTVTITVPYNYGDSGCPEVLLNRVNVVTAHAQTNTTNMVETRERFTFNVENYPSDRCTAASNPHAMTPMIYDVLLPAGTRASTVRVEYWLDGGWQPAECTYGNGFQCRAMYPNPLLADKYQVRTMINNQEHSGTYISLGNKCIIFEPPTNQISMGGID